MVLPAYYYCRDPSENIDHIRAQKARDKEYKDSLRPMKARRIARLTQEAKKGRK